MVVGGSCRFGICIAFVVLLGGRIGSCCGCSRVVQLVSDVFDLGAQESMVLAIGDHTTLVIYIHLLPCFHFRSFGPAAAAVAAAAPGYHSNSEAD